MSKLLEILKNKELSAKEIIELTDTPKSTIYRTLASMLEDGSLSQDGDKYKIAKFPPSPREVADDMEIIYQQKMMDKAYRRKSIYSKADLVLDWYMDFQLKGKVTDYNQDKLLDNIQKGWNFFMSKHHLDYEKDKV